MILYKKFITPDRTVDILRWEADNENDFKSDPESNLYGEDNKHSYIEKNIREEVKRYNTYIKRDVMKLRKCKKCGKYFLMGRSDIEVYKEEHEPLPQYCPRCKDTDLTCDNTRFTAKVIRDPDI